MAAEVVGGKTGGEGDSFFQGFIFCEYFFQLGKLLLCTSDSIKESPKAQISVMLALGWHFSITFWRQTFVNTSYNLRFFRLIGIYRSLLAWPKFLPFLLLLLIQRLQIRRPVYSLTFNILC